MDKIVETLGMLREDYLYLSPEDAEAAFREAYASA